MLRKRWVFPPCKYETQAAALCLFNSRESIKFPEMVELLGVEEKYVKALLHPMVCNAIKVLSKATPYGDGMRRVCKCVTRCVQRAKDFIQ